MKNGDIPDEVALNKGQIQLKKEVIELSEQVNLLVGGSPTAWVDATSYLLCDFVSYLGNNYNARIDHTSDLATNAPFITDTVTWELVTTTSTISIEDNAIAYAIALG